MIDNGSITGSHRHDLVLALSWKVSQIILKQTSYHFYKLLQYFPNTFLSDM